MYLIMKYISRLIPLVRSDMSSKQRVGEILNHIEVPVQETACGGLEVTSNQDEHVIMSRIPYKLM